MQRDQRVTLIAFGQFTLARVGDALLAVLGVALMHVSPYQIMLFYSGVGFLCMLPWAVRNRATLWRPQRFKLNCLRACFEYGCFALGFYALHKLDIPKQTAIGFAAPLFSTILAILWLKERAYAHTWLSLLVGFVGMLIITRPGVIPLDVYVGAAAISSVGFGFCGVFIKQLTATEPTRHIAFYMLGLTTLLALLPGDLHWQTPHGVDWLWLIAIGIIAFSQQVLVAASTAAVPLLTLMPLSFLRLVFVSILAYAIYGQVIDRWTLIGAVVIMGATLYDTWATTTKAQEIRHT